MLLLLLASITIAPIVSISNVKAQELIWSATNVGNGTADGVAVDSTGVYVVGASPTDPEGDWRVEKRSLTDGSLLWSATSDPSPGLTDSANGVAVDGTGVYAVGLSSLATARSPDVEFRVEKSSPSDGSLIWSATSNPTAGWDSANGVAVDATGVYVVGTDVYASEDDCEVGIPGSWTGFAEWTVEKRSLTDGSLLWSETSDPTPSDPSQCDLGNDGANGVAVDGSGVYVVGYDSPPGEVEFRVEKRSLTDGSLLWSATSNPRLFVGGANGVAVDSTGVYVVGVDYVFEKRSLTDGSLLWSATSNPSSGLAYANGVAVDGTGVYAVGSDWLPLDSSNEWRIEKRSLTDGSLIWTTTSNPSPLDDVAYGVAVDGTGVYAVGMDCGAIGGCQEWRVEKWSSPNTPTGSDVAVSLNGGLSNVEGVQLSFDTVSIAGTTSVTTTSTGPPPPNSFSVAGVYYDITTTASVTPPVEVCIHYNEADVSGQESNLKLMHQTETGWVDITSPGYPDTTNDIICGTTDSFSFFAVMEPVSFDFNLVSSPSSRTVAQGQATSYDVSLSLESGAPEYVSLSVSGLPSGAIATLTPASVTPAGTSTLFVTTAETTPPGPYTLTIEASGGGVNKLATVSLIVAPIQEQSFMTDSQFARVTSFDTVFTNDKASGSFTLAATNPGTYFYNKILRNTGSSTLTVAITLSIPSSVNPSLSQAFLLKGSNPIHLYANLARTIDVTNTAAITPQQPLTGPTTTASTLTLSFSVAGGELRYLTVHLDFAAKGSKGFSSDAGTTYRQGFRLTEAINVDGLPGTIEDPTTFTAVGKRVTAIGGFALDTNLMWKSALKVRVFSGSTLIADSSITPPDGFYFADVPAGGPYTVQLVNPTTNVIVRSALVNNVARDEYVSVDFLNLNPADPAIEGFVFDHSTNGVSGITVQLYGPGGRLLASTVTTSSGWYAFRFTQPGKYTVEILAPQGYSAGVTMVTVNIRQFETLRVDFTVPT